MNRREAQRLKDVALDMIDLAHFFHTGHANEISFENWRDEFAREKSPDAARKQWSTLRNELRERGLGEDAWDGRENHLVLKRKVPEVGQSLLDKAMKTLGEGEGPEGSEVPDQVTIAGKTYRLNVFGQSVRPLSDAEYAALRSDIQAKGAVEVPVIVDSAYNVVDGKSRLLIAGELGLSQIPVVVRTDRTPGQLDALAVDLNAWRRHYTQKELASLRRERRERVQSKRTESSSLRKIAEEEGVSYETVRNDLERSDQAQVNEKAVGLDGYRRPTRKLTPAEHSARRARVAKLIAENKTRREIAEELGVSTGTVFNDVKALEAAPEPEPEAPPPSYVEEIKVSALESIDPDTALWDDCLLSLLERIEAIQASAPQDVAAQLSLVVQVVEALVHRAMNGDSVVNCQGVDS